MQVLVFLLEQSNLVIFNFFGTQVPQLFHDMDYYKDLVRR